MKTFPELNLPESLQKSVAKLGFTQPTEIQAKSIPILLEGRDLIGQSKTGSGKTAAYLLPLFNTVMNSDFTSLVLLPTRELAYQVEEFARKLTGPGAHVRIATIIGGTSIKFQLRALSQKPHLIVSTPGRLVDHIGRGTVNFANLKFLVLDEADRMLDMGFYPQIKNILAVLPKNRQTALFSATFSDQVRNLTRELVRNPIDVSVGVKNEAPVTIDQQTIETEIAKKNDLLVDELNKRQGSVLIFVKTKHKTDRMARYLNEFGFNVGRIHGDRSLAQRRQAIDQFRSGASRILVATDIAARGLDIAQVAHVINFDLPQTPEDYVHRIGRTGRAGASGQAVSFLTSEDREMWRMITRLMQKSSGAQNGRDEYRGPRVAGFQGAKQEAPRFEGRRPESAPRRGGPREDRRGGRPPGGRPQSGRPARSAQGGRPQRAGGSSRPSRHGEDRDAQTSRDERPNKWLSASAPREDRRDSSGGPRREGGFKGRSKPARPSSRPAGNRW